MTSNGEGFSVRAALAGIDTLLDRPVPAAGPTLREDGQGWTGSRGAGFRIAVLWESRDYVGVPGADWDAAQDRVAGYLAALAGELDARWGSHRSVSMRPFLIGDVGADDASPLFEEICSFDLYGDLLVWGPVAAPLGRRWVSISANQSDEDAPHLMFAAVSAHPVTDPGD